MNYPKTFLYSLLLVLLIGACKKNDENPAQDTGIDPSDAKSLFLNIKINHAQKSDGKLPSESGDGPKLDAVAGNQAIPAIGGKFAVITPKLLSGEIAGYYLRIVGYDDAYYKIDFIRPVSGRKKPLLLKSQDLPKKIMDDNPDYTDSSIVIRLPDNIKPGTFCAEYIAYDWSSHTSNAVTQCITVSSLGGEPKLTGKWSVEKTKYGTEGWKYYPVADSVYPNYYACDNNNKPFTVYDSSQAKFQMPSLIRKYEYFYWQFAADGGGGEVSNEIEETLDFINSTCNNFKFIPEEKIRSSTFIWSFDIPRNKLVLVFEDDNPIYTYFLEVDIAFINENRFSLDFTTGENGLEESAEFVRVP